MNSKNPKLKVLENENRVKDAESMLLGVQCVNFPQSVVICGAMSVVILVPSGFGLWFLLRDKVKL